jgi:hypothetical protein
MSRWVAAGYAPIFPERPLRADFELGGWPVNFVKKYVGQLLRFQPFRTNRAAHLASSAAFRFPSPADTIEPFINMCHICANFSGSRKFASSAKPRTIARIFARWIAAA